MPLTGQREAQLLESVDALLDARRTRIPIKTLPYVPATHDEALFIQDRLITSYGGYGGWKIGASSPTAEPSGTPMPAAWMAPTNATIASGRLRGVEAEVAFLLGADLPARATPYSDEEVYAAVASCHPAIEVLETGLDYPVAPELNQAKIADLQLNGGFVYGPAYPDWRAIDFAQESVVLAIEGIIRVERTASNLPAIFFACSPGSSTSALPAPAACAPASGSPPVPGPAPSSPSPANPSTSTSKPWAA